MSTPTVLLLGPPRIEINGLPVELDTRKGIALLAYLAMSGQRHSRDALAALLWPDYGESRARASLRRTLSSLNRALAGNGLLIERESVGLDPERGLWIDAQHFHELLASSATDNHPPSTVCERCLPLLNEAVTLYRDDFLAGFTLRDSPPFDEWQFFQAESLRRELAGALERLVRSDTERGAFESAIQHARRRLALDPLHEPAHRALIELYAWAGERGAALRQFRECVRILEQELGVAPLEETARLYQQIKERQLAPPAEEPEPAPVSSTGTAGESRDTTVVAEPEPPEVDAPSFTPPLVGRSAEWATLRRAYSSARADGRVVILEGEAGVGKTRLAEEFLRDARMHGATTVTARCYEGEANLTYGLFVEALRAGLRQLAPDDNLADAAPNALSEAARLLPETANRVPRLPVAQPLDTPGAQNRFFEGVRVTLLRLCAGAAPGILFLDDLQWIDPASLDMLAYTLRRLRGDPVLVLATWRSEQAPSGRRLRQVLAEAQRAGHATTVTLRRLDSAAITQLVHAVAAGFPSGPADPRAARSRMEQLSRRLYEETEGLPLFVREYLMALRDASPTMSMDGWPLPGGVRDLLQSRLRTVSETGWQLLTTAAIIGRSFDFDTLRDVSGRGDEEVLAGLETLVAQHLIEERIDPNEQTVVYDFSHAKTRGLVYDDMSLVRRRLLHRRVADALIRPAHGRREPGAVAGQVGHHLRLAGSAPEAATYYMSAGDYARTLYANVEALNHYRAALALGHPEAATLHEAIGDLQTLLGEYAAALASYETAAALAVPAALATIEHKLGMVHHRRGAWALAESHFEAALAALEINTGAAKRAWIYADWSLTAHRGGQARRIDATPRTLAEEALRLAEQAADQSALAKAHNILGLLAREQGELDTARHHLEQSLAQAEALADTGACVAALNNLALVARSAGNPSGAIILARRALDLCATQGDRHREAALHNNLADLYHSVGQADQAMAHLKQAVTIYAEIGVEAGAIQPQIWGLAEW